MAPKEIDVLSLPQKGVWQCYVHKLRAWVAGNGGLPLKDGAFLACEPGETDDEAGGGNVVKKLPSSETVLAFLQRVMTHPRLMNTSKAGEKRAPARPKAIRFADTATAALHLGDKDKWAGETACPYVEGCKAGLAALGVDDCSFAPVPQRLIQEIIRGQIEPNMEWGTQLLPGLMESVEGFTSAFGASLFAAAASFTRASPWESLASRRPIQLTYRLVLREDVAMKLTAFGAVVGDKESGSFGLSVHKTLEEAIAAFDLENGGEGEEAAAAGGQSCMFASVYETPFEDMDAAEAGKWELAAGEEPGEEYWPLFCKIAFEKGENGGEDALAITRPAIIELQCFELMFKGMVDLLSSGELKSKGDTVRDAAGPWTVKAQTMAGSEAGEHAEVELEISLPSMTHNNDALAYV